MMQFFFDAPDRWLFVMINQKLSGDLLDGFMIFLSSKWAMLPVYLFVLIAYFRKSRKNFTTWILLTVVAFGLADSISSKVFKPTFKRVRPSFEATLSPRLPNGLPGSKYGFVSSHSANMFAVFGIAGMLLGMGKKGKMALYFLAFLVAYSRVYLGVHYPADVFFGGILGYCIAGMLFALWRWLCVQSPWKDKLENTVKMD